MAKRVKYDGEWYIQDGCGAWVPEREYWKGSDWEARHPVLAAILGALCLIGIFAGLMCLGV